MKSTFARRAIASFQLHFRHYTSLSTRILLDPTLVQIKRQEDVSRRTEKAIKTIEAATRSTQRAVCNTLINKATMGNTDIRPIGQPAMLLVQELMWVSKPMINMLPRLIATKSSSMAMVAACGVCLLLGDEFIRSALMDQISQVSAMFNSQSNDVSERIQTHQVAERKSSVAENAYRRFEHHI